MSTFASGRMVQGARDGDLAGVLIQPCGYMPGMVKARVWKNRETGRWHWRSYSGHGDSMVWRDAISAALAAPRGGAL